PARSRAARARRSGPRYASRPPPRLGPRERALELRVFAARGLEEVMHPDRLAPIGREEGAVERDVATVAAGDRERRQALVRQRRRRRRGGKDALPDRRAVRRIREGELDDEANAAEERRIEGALLIRREDGEAAIGFHALEQVAHLDVGVAVVAVAHL